MKTKPEQPYAGPLRAALGLPDHSVASVENRASYHMATGTTEASNVSFGIGVAIMLDMMRDTVNVEEE
ncbi:MAG: hypothetical protein HY556_11325 [Euryarchaeota archaeon]|nr:hypothetical protein [Euryarchaeota archaeon]